MAHNRVKREWESAGMEGSSPEFPLADIRVTREWVITGIEGLKPQWFRPKHGLEDNNNPMTNSLGPSLMTTPKHPHLPKNPNRTVKCKASHQEISPKNG